MRYSLLLYDLFLKNNEEQIKLVNNSNQKQIQKLQKVRQNAHSHIFRWWPLKRYDSSQVHHICCKTGVIVNKLKGLDNKSLNQKQNRKFQRLSNLIIIITGTISQIKNKVTFSCVLFLTKNIRKLSSTSLTLSNPLLSIFIVLSIA